MSEHPRPAPRSVATPQQAARVAKRLGQDAVRMEQIIGGLDDYFDDLPGGGQDEILLRLSNLAQRIEAFRTARNL